MRPTITKWQLNGNWYGVDTPNPSNSTGLENTTEE